MMPDKLHDKCAVIGVFGVSPATDFLTVAGYRLQHRGQESFKTCTTDGKRLFTRGGMGTVAEVTKRRRLHDMPGHAGIAHGRYGTRGRSTYRDAQPLTDTKNAVAHNGQIANYALLRARMQEDGVNFSTGVDTEVPFRRWAACDSDDLWERLRSTFDGVAPSYSMLFLTKDALVAIRDPCGVKPLSLFETDGGFMVASETIASQGLDAKIIGDLGAGEAAVFTENGMERRQVLPARHLCQCIFEHIYFAHPSSFLFGSDVTVGEVRKEFGRISARNYPVDADVAVPVPDSGNHGALGYAEESGIPFDFGFDRSHYIGRTFILPNQALRDAAVDHKFTTNRSVFAGKRVVLVDDSIVRATTLMKLVARVYEMGAAEVHARIPCPPYMHSCYLGIDTAKKKRLIARHNTVQEIADHVGLTSLAYLTVDEMLSNRHLKGRYCTYCFDGEREIHPRRLF